MDIIIGTYDSHISGFQLIKNRGNSSSDLEIKHKFSDVSHKGCIKCLEVSEQGILASGSTDERIQLFDLEKGLEVGTLVSHAGDVTCLKFIGKDFLYSSSADGTIRMWRPRIWELQRTLNAHKAAVLCFDIHPSTKLALSVSSDKKLVLWDLVACRYSFVRHMKKCYESVQFNESGSFYAMKFGTSVEIFELGAVEPAMSLDMKSRINHVSKVSDNLFATGTEDGKIHIISISEKKVVIELQAHGGRVRGVVGVSTSQSGLFMLVSCSSTGSVKTWSLNLPLNSFHLLAEINTDCRITCLAIYGSRMKADDLLGITLEKMGKSEETIQPKRKNKKTIDGTKILQAKKDKKLALKKKKTEKKSKR